MKKNKNVIMKLLILSIIFVLSMSFMAISYASEGETEVEMFGADGVKKEDSATTLEDAVTQVESKGKIVLQKGVAIQKLLTIPTNKEITLDLNGYTITRSSDSLSNIAIFQVPTGTTLNVINDNSDNDLYKGGMTCTVAADTDDSRCIHVDGGTVTIEGGTYDANSSVWVGENANVTIKNGKFDGVFPVVTHGKDNNVGTITINNGQFTGCLYFAGKGTYNITGGTFEAKAGESALEIKRGTLTIEDGTTFTANASQNTEDLVVNDNGTGPFVGAIVVSKAAGYGGEVSVKIHGGTFTNNAGDAIVMVNQATETDHASSIEIASENNNNNNITINGNVANYTKTNTNTNTISIGTGTTVNGSVIGENIETKGAIIQEKNSTVDVIVDDTLKSSFDTIEEALNFAKTLESEETTPTLKLTQDVIDGGFDIGEDIVGFPPHKIIIDLGGHTLTFEEPVGSTNTVTNGIRVLYGSTLELKNGKLNTGNLEKLRTVIANYGTMTLDDVEIIGGMDNVNYTINNRGNLTLTGKTNVPTGKHVPRANLTEGFAITNDPYNYVPEEVTFNAELNVAGPDVIVGKVQVEQYPRNDGDRNKSAIIKLNITAGKFDSIESDGKNDVTVKGNITGGLFKKDPSAYVADDYVVVGSDDPEYLYTIARKVNTDLTVETKPELPKLENKYSNQFTLSEEKFGANEDVLKASAMSVANNRLPYTDAIVTTRLEEANINIDNKTVEVVVRPYIKIEVTSYNPENTTLTFDVKALYDLIATTSDVVSENKKFVFPEDNTPGTNAVRLGIPQTLTVNRPIELTFELPAGFVESNKDLFVHHTKEDGKTYIYKVEKYNKQDNTITFTNPNGFSEFVVTKDGGAAKIGDTHYATLKDAINALALIEGNVTETDKTITLLADNTEDITLELTGKDKFTFTLDQDKFTFNGTITASGFDLKTEKDTTKGTITYTFTKKKQSGGGSSSGGGSGVTKYKITVTVGPNGNVTPSGNVRVEKGKDQRFDITPNNGYVVEDVKVDGESVGAVTSYTFEDVTKAHTLSVTFKAGNGTTPTDPSTTNTRYADVARNAWFYKAIEYVSEKGLMQGTGANKFDPDVSVTRGMMATVLYRLSGANTNGTSTFTDVPAGSYYSNAIAWAAEKGIVTGVGENRFDPERAIKREEMATMIARYISTMEVSIETTGEAGAAYADAGTISSFATEAVNTMKTTGLMEGKNGNNFDPAGLATRAEVATILMRFVEKTTTK